MMDLVAQGVIGENLIRFDVNLIETFELYWVRIIGALRESNPLMPFYHLHSEGFWHLVEADGRALDVRYMDRAEVFRRIRDQAIFARLDDNLFAAVASPEGRGNLRSLLIERYFTPEARVSVAQASQITAESYDYGREITKRSHERFSIQEAPSRDERYATEVRSTAFRRVIVDAYRHTCAVCRIRVMTPEGLTSVEAAHIVPWRHSHNDDPRNGMALCGLHHWVFDHGLIGVTSEYTIRVSPILLSQDQYVEPLIALEGREIHRPVDRMLWPARAALRWHMDNTFRPAKPYSLL
jgi:putative restriction endonuclease